MNFKKIIKTISLITITCLIGCSINNNSKRISYLNNYYSLTQVAFIGDGDPLENEVLSKYDTCVFYTRYFNCSESYINFQCKGDDYDSFYCEGSLVLIDNNNNVVLENNSFRCHADVGLYFGEIVFEDKRDSEIIGHIYINTPHWCRIQLNYTVNDEEHPQLLTFEFFKGKFNELPSFIGE